MCFQDRLSAVELILKVSWIGTFSCCWENSPPEYATPTFTFEMLAFFFSSKMLICCACYSALVRDAKTGWCLEHLTTAMLVLYTPVPICGSRRYIKDYRWHFYIFQITQIISLSDASRISKLIFLSEAQISLTELPLSVSDQEPWATDITEILSFDNKLYSGNSSGAERCIVSNGIRIHIYKWWIS